MTDTGFWNQCKLARACVLCADHQGPCVVAMPGPTAETVTLAVPPIDPLHEALIGAQAAAAEVRRILFILKAVEWGDHGICDIRCCPECGGYDPGAKDSPAWHAGYHTNREGHSPDCDLGNAVRVDL